MNVQVIQHVPYEGPGQIAAWADDRGHTVSVTSAPTDAFPLASTYDLLVIMGGPMNAYEVDLYPWLAEEKRAITAAIEADKGVLGVCLGAQLVADALGGVVRRNDGPEIGWYPVALTGAGIASPVFGALPPHFIAGHWHWDMFEIPHGAVRVASSDACRNQAYEYDDGRIVGVQFHLEWTFDGLRELVAHAGEDLIASPWVQSEEALLALDAPFGRTTDALMTLLDAMERRLAR